MEKLIFLLEAFGFKSFQDLWTSTFGHINLNVIVWGTSATFLVTIANAIEPIFGVEWMFFFAYVGLVILELATGVLASLDRGEKHESRKLGRMVLKVFIYMILIALLHQMTKIVFPKGFAFLEHFSPFKWLYWVMMVIIIWQLWISVLENLKSLGFRFAKVALQLINRKFNKQFEIDDTNSTT